MGWQATIHTSLPTSLLSQPRNSSPRQSNVIGLATAEPSAARGVISRCGSIICRFCIVDFPKRILSLAWYCFGSFWPCTKTGKRPYPLSPYKKLPWPQTPTNILLWVFQPNLQLLTEISNINIKGKHNNLFTSSGSYMGLEPRQCMPQYMLCRGRTLYQLRHREHDKFNMSKINRIVSDPTLTTHWHFFESLIRPFALN